MAATARARVMASPTGTVMAAPVEAVGSRSPLDGCAMGATSAGPAARAAGLDRAITKTELARALKLSPGHGSDFIRKVERGAASLSGTAEVAISMMLGGARPPTMDDVIKPGYPRGSRWNLDAPEPETPAGPETTA